MVEKNLFALTTFLLFLLLQNVSGQNPQKMDMNQTLSDGAQSHQIAFDGLGFITGNFCACSFVPPGKVADYFGFQYTRDNDVTGMGHNSDFSSILANNLLYVLDNNQKALIVQTAKAQVAIIQQYAYLRFPLIDAFVRMRDKNMPSGCSGLDSTAIKEYSAKLYRVDGRVCLQRAQVYSSIINSFTAKQKHYLDSVKVLGGRNMPNLGEQIDKKAFGINDNNVFVGVMSIADDIYSWYTGNLESDVYICPERQGNYFGSFYLKDAPAMLQPDYSIDTDLSQSGGQRFLNTLNTEQKAFITELTEKQKSEMYDLVERRTDISKLLRGYLSGTNVDTSKVLDLSEEYGELDGIISYYYATNFSKVNWTLTTAQMDTLMKIRNLDEFPCNGAYLYSDPIAMPSIENTDFLFQASSVNVQQPERIATGFQFTEGPCWMDDAGGYLLFSDIDANKVYKWSSTGGVKEFIANSGKSNGLATDGYGNLYLAQQGSRQIGKQKIDGSIENLCSTFGGKRLNSPNDLVVNKNGSVFFTDPDYGVTPANKELAYNGVYILQKGKTEPKLLINDLPKPNGIALSPDEWNLYVCDSELKKVFGYEMKSESEIRRKYEFAIFSGEIDGIKTDLDGNVYVAVSDVGIQVFSSKGELKQTINLPEKTRNLYWGDQYRNTLYITAGNSIYRMKINPDFPYVQTELLSRPTASSVTLSMMTEAETEMYVEYGLATGTYTLKTSTVTCTPGIPRTIEISGLNAGKTYYYRVCYRISGGSAFQTRKEYTFQTQRKAGESFTFDIHADPHLDESSNYQTYSNALQNTLIDSPDFMVDLGDNFMSDKLPVQDYQTIEKRAILFRHFYEKAGHSVPLYMVMGNHEAEAGWELDGSSENVAVWNTLIRKKYFQNPEPNQFYTGDSIPENYVGLRGNYYAWNWGDALFVVIDPYWFTSTKPGTNDDGWQWTLGEVQYKWLRTTLEKSTSKYKFIFCHQIVGGDEQGRGGTELVKYFEMGGYNSDGSYGFDVKRPGWGKPLHQLFVDNGVTAYFHGHDHFYDRQELDGVIYQLVPQPSLFNYTATDMAAEYGYTTGTIFPNSGYLRVNVSSDSVSVDYIRAFHADNPKSNQINGSVAYSYTIGAAQTQPVEMTEILGRPTDHSISISVLFNQPVELSFEYGTNPTQLTLKSQVLTAEPGVPVEYNFENLSPNTRYFYRTLYRMTGETNYRTGEQHQFMTQRAKGSSFQFTIEADPHPYDKKGYHPLWNIAMQNQLKDSADFMIDMGDTFGDDHNPFDITDQEIKQLHLDCLPFFGQVCHSSPLFLCLGNHEGESGYYLAQTPPNNLAVSATKWRKFYYPNPYPDGFYSGNTQQEGNGIGNPENYYAYEWGDALFVVLDVYRYYTANAKPRGWDWTIGKEQYDWFKSTLENSKAKFKFVFAHHVLGETRGGIIPAKESEWGGYESNSTNYTFDENRPGWGLPLHQLMVKNNVDIFFQGHDHLFAREELDSLIYQTIPMPDDSSYEIGVTDNGDAFSGLIMKGSGHLLVNVSAEKVKVDFVSAVLPQDETDNLKNNQVVYSYTIEKKSEKPDTTITTGEVSLTIESAPSGDVCEGAPVLFTANPLNAGDNSTYQWKVNGINAGTNGNTYSYLPANNDQISCTVTTNPGAGSTKSATSNTLIESVISKAPVSVTINSTISGTICEGTSVKYTAKATNEGDAPTYQWKVNGLDVGSNKKTYNYTPANNDQITCLLTSSLNCVSSNPALSNSITERVDEKLPVSVSIVADPSENIYQGIPIIFTASPINGGNNQGISWKVNGTDVGNNNTSFTYTPANNDQITCELTSSLNCVSGNPATSNTLEISTLTDVESSVNGKAVSVYPNPASSILNITSIEENSEVTIYDLSGKVCFYKQNAGGKMDVSSLQNGIYTLRISNNDKVVFLKFIKR